MLILAALHSVARLEKHGDIGTVPGEICRKSRSLLTELRHLARLCMRRLLRLHLDILFAVDLHLLLVDKGAFLLVDDGDRRILRLV